MARWSIAALFIVIASAPSTVRAQWYASFDFVASFRSDNSQRVFQRNQVNDGAVDRVGSVILLSADDLELDFLAGGRIIAGNRSGIFGVEGSYMNTGEWHERASVFDSSGMASPFTPVGAVVVPAVDNNTSVVVNYATRMESAEIHLAQRFHSGPNGDASLLYGVRYLGIDESLSYDSLTAVPTSNSIAIDVNNRLIGPQVGTLIETPLDGGTVNYTFKFALAHHKVDKSTWFNATAGNGDDDGVALIGEFDVNGSFSITPSLHLRLGYQLLAITDTALATDNFETNLAVLNSGTADVRMNRGLIYHGPYIGVMFVH